MDRTRQTLGYAETLKRGFVVLRGDGHVVTTRAEADAATAFEVEFSDGRLPLGPRPRSRKPGDGADGTPGQGTLF